MKAQRPSAERTGAFCGQQGSLLRYIYAFSQCLGVTLPNPELLSSRWKPPLPEQSRAKQGLCLGLKLHVPAHLPGMSLGAFLVPPQQGTWGQITLTSIFTHTHAGTAFGKHHNIPCSSGLWETHSKVLQLFSVPTTNRGQLHFPRSCVPSRCLQLICQQSMVLYVLIEVYSSNLPMSVSYLDLITMSGFSCVLSIMASHRCALRTKFLLMDGSAYIRD